MEGVVKRIRELIDNQGLSNSEFANKINVGPAVVSHIMSGRNKPSLQVISNIKSSFTNVNIDYLVSGHGPLFSDNTNVKRTEVPSASEESFTNVTSDEVRMLPPPEGPPTERLTEDLPEEQPSDPQASKGLQKEKTPSSKPLQKNESEPAIDRIVIFYSDGSFKSYRP